MFVCVCVFAGSLAGQTSGGSSLSPVTSMALGGLTGSPLNTMASINGLGSTGLTHNGTGLDALTSAYSNIQQYTGMVMINHHSYIIIFQYLRLIYDGWVSLCHMKVVTVHRSL